MMAKVFPRRGLSAPEAFSFPGCVDKSDVLAFELARPKRLLCTKGVLWITVQGDRNDYLVDGSRDMAVPRKRRVVVEAEEPSCFEFE